MAMQTMMNRKTVSVTTHFLVGLAAAWASSAYAHHSFAMFDGDKLLTLDGTIYSVEWKNPHGWFWIAVKNDKGDTDVWGLEGASAGQFTRLGFSKSDFVAGTKVKVEIHPLKDGRTGGQFLRMTFPDGRQVGSLSTAVDEYKEKGYVK